MKIFTCTTSGATVRDEIIGWTFEDSDLFVFGKEIGEWYWWLVKE